MLVEEEEEKKRKKKKKRKEKGIKKINPHDGFERGFLLDPNENKKS